MELDIVIDSEQKLRKCNLPFNDCLAREVIDPCVKNLLRKPKILIIDGAPGTGKTTLAIHIIDYVNKATTDLSGKDCIQLAQGGKQLMQKSELCSKQGLKVIIFDEADLDKRGALTKYNNSLFSYFREYRSQELLIIVIIQNFEWLDNRLWTLGAVEGLIHLKAPKKDRTTFNVYDLTGCAQLLTRMEKMGKYHSIRAYSQIHGYLYGEFYDLSPQRREQLRKISDHQKTTSRKKRIKTIEEIEVVK